MPAIVLHHQGRERPGRLQHCEFFPGRLDRLVNIAVVVTVDPDDDVDAVCLRDEARTSADWSTDEAALLLRDADGRMIARFSAADPGGGPPDPTWTATGGPPGGEVRSLAFGADGVVFVVDDGCPEKSGVIAQSIIDAQGLGDRVRVLFLEDAIDSGRLFVVGHSEGALIATELAVDPTIAADAYRWARTFGIVTTGLILAYAPGPAARQPTWMRPSASRAAAMGQSSVRATTWNPPAGSCSRFVRFSKAVILADIRITWL